MLRRLFGRVGGAIANIVGALGGGAPKPKPEPPSKPEPGVQPPEPKPVDREAEARRYAPEPISPPERERPPRDYLGGRIRYVGYDDRENYPKTERRPGKYATLQDALRHAKKIPVAVTIIRRRVQAGDEWGGFYELVVGESP